MEALGEIERKALEVLSTEWKSEQEIAKESKLPLDSVRRAMQWLSSKGFAQVQETPQTALQLSEAGKKALKEGLPEKKFLNELKARKGRAEMGALEKALGMGKEFNFVFGTLKQKAFVTVSKGEKGIEIALSGLEEEYLESPSAEESALEKIADGSTLSDSEQEVLPSLLKRGLAEKKESVQRSYCASGKTAEVSASKGEINILSHEILESGVWKQKSFRKYNLQDPVPPIFGGKKQPYLQFLEQIRSKLTGLGFEEMKAPLIVSEFYNFDVLFQPQHHPARTWSDTYSLKAPKKGKLPSPAIVKRVKEAHEFGGKTGSKGWQYEWSEDIAQKLMPAAHGTAHSARTLIEGPNIPGKYFAIARCFRPDVLDATHLLEFNQMEGIILGKELNFRHLLGMLKEFAIEIAGAEKVKFFPDYYPFTEPSVQLSAKHPELGWIEFGGAGIFRPELMEGVNVDATCLAWGLGIDRLAMFKLGINDIRQLFSDDLKWLRNAKMVKP
ncbi:MAG: phenylalanine--tRNA ligase subunit alpha [Candidatus Diapherotrites archaeon]